MVPVYEHRAHRAALERKIAEKRAELEALRKTEAVGNQNAHRSRLATVEAQLMTAQAQLIAQCAIDQAETQGAEIFLWSDLLVLEAKNRFNVPIHSRRTAWGQRTYAVAAWLPIVLLLFGVLPLFHAVFRTTQVRRRRAKNCCVCCGYPLQGLLEPRCPECGHLAESRSPTTP